MQKHVMLVLVLFASMTLPMVVTPAWAAGGPVATFARTYSVAAGAFIATSVRQTTDGGFIVAGVTSASVGLQTWLLRLDATGAVVWQKGYAANACNICFGTLLSFPHALQTPDGGFVVEATANISSTISRITIAALVFKVDSTGSMVWQKAFTAVGNATASSIDTTSDGGIVVTGTTGLGVGAPGSGAPTVALVLKLDSMGGLLWEKTYNGLGGSAATSIRQTSDGGFVVAGATTNVFKGSNSWVLKLNSDGIILWQNTYVGGGSFLLSIQQTSDGGFIAAGTTGTTIVATGGLLVLRLDRTGAPVWQKSYGGVGDLPFSIGQNSDGSFIVAGGTGLGTPSPSASVLRLDTSGTIVWQRAFSGPSAAVSVQQTSDGGFVVVGVTFSSMLAPFQALVFKLNSMGGIHPCKDLSKTSLVASTLSTPATSITGGSPVDITTTAPGTTTTFASTDTSATATVVCR